MSGLESNTAVPHQIRKMWRDKSTATILRPGAVQNWPTSNEQKQMTRDRIELQRKEAEMLALKRKLAKEGKEHK